MNNVLVHPIPLSLMDEAHLREGGFDPEDYVCLHATVTNAQVASPMVECAEPGGKKYRGFILALLAFVPIEDPARCGGLIIAGADGKPTIDMTKVMPPNVPPTARLLVAKAALVPEARADVATEQAAWAKAPLPFRLLGAMPET